MKIVSIYCNIAILLCFLSSQTVLAEDIDISTFYPSPYGNYQTLETTSNTNLATTSGIVGIGTATPDAGSKLQVNGTGNVLFNTTGNVGIGTITPASQLHVVHPAATAAFRVDTGPADVNPLVIDQNGNVGIGTATPQTVLDVDGGIKVGPWTVCDGAHAGTLRWAGNASSEQFQFCDGTIWRRSLSEASSCAPLNATRDVESNTCFCGIGSLVCRGIAHQVCEDQGGGVLKWETQSTDCSMCPACP
jgi:hypothetical protein